MLLKNSFTHDARVYKEAMTLVMDGHYVVIIAIKDETTKEFENIKGIIVKRITVADSKIKKIIKKLLKGDNAISSSESLMGEPVKKTMVKFKFFRDLRWVFLLEFKFIKAAIKEKADIYHAHELLTLFHGYVASRINRARLIYDAHELQSELVTTFAKHPKIEKFKCEIIERIFIKKANSVITVSDSISNVLESRYKINKPIVIKNCPFLTSIENNDKIRTILGISKSKKIILYQGNFTPDKDIDKLIEIALYLNDEVLVMIGDGVIKKIIEKKIKSMKIENRVFLLGHIPNNKLLHYTVSADLGISVFPNSCLNIYYSLPNKLFEYLMVGVPVIASNFPEIKKIIEEYRVGKVVDSMNPKIIANAIKLIFNDSDSYRQMHLNALKITKDIFNWENESKKLLSLYDELKNRKNCKYIKQN